MTKPGRAVEMTGGWKTQENQKQVSQAFSTGLGNRMRDSHIPTAPTTISTHKDKTKERKPYGISLRSIPSGSFFNENMLSAVVFAYDKNGNLTSKAEYDYLSPNTVTRSPSPYTADTKGLVNGMPSNGAILRLTTNGYYYPAEDSSTAASNTSANGYWSNFRTAV